MCISNCFLKCILLYLINLMLLCLLCGKYFIKLLNMSIKYLLYYAINKFKNLNFYMYISTL